MRQNLSQFYLQHMENPKYLENQVEDSIYKMEGADKTLETILNCYKSISSDVFSEKSVFSTPHENFYAPSDPNSSFFQASELQDPSALGSSTQFPRSLRTVQPAFPSNSLGAGFSGDSVSTGLAGRQGSMFINPAGMGGIRRSGAT